MCREGSEQWLAQEQGNAWRTFAEPIIAPGFDDAGHILSPVPFGLSNLVITPITLHHSSADVAADDLTRRLPSSAGFVIQTATRKAVLFWDMDNSNTWISHPQHEAHEAALAMARYADVLCIDCNTWRFAGSTSGQSHFFSHPTVIRACAGTAPDLADAPERP